MLFADEFLIIQLYLMEMIESNHRMIRQENYVIKELALDYHDRIRENADMHHMIHKMMSAMHIEEVNAVEHHDRNL